MSVPANATVKTTVAKSRSIVYSANGLLLFQGETVTTTEYRGLDEGAACAMVASGFSDQSSTVTYYHSLGDGVANATVTVGTYTSVTAQRINEAGFWRAIETKIEYEPIIPTGSGWTTTAPAAGNGITGSVARKRSVVTVVEGYSLVLMEETTTTEWRNCTAAQVGTLINGIPPDTMTVKTFICRQIATEIGRHMAEAGTRYSRQARYISATEGWTVTQECTTISLDGSLSPNWSQLS